MPAMLPAFASPALLAVRALALPEAFRGALVLAAAFVVAVMGLALWRRQRAKHIL